MENKAFESLCGTMRGNIENSDNVARMVGHASVIAWALTEERVDAMGKGCKDAIMATMAMSEASFNLAQDNDTVSEDGFDLDVYMRSFAVEVAEEYHLDGDIYTNTLMNIGAFAFKAGYEKLTKEDMLRFIDKKDFGELENKSIIYVWANEHGIQANDVFSVLKGDVPYEFSEDELQCGREALGSLGDLLEKMYPMSFEAFKPEIFPMTLDEFDAFYKQNKETCRDFFASVYATLNVLPSAPKPDAMKPEAISSMFDYWADTMVGEKIKDVKDKGKRNGYLCVFSIAVSCAILIRDIDKEHDMSGFYEQVNKDKAKLK